jgi:hypothetical protein
MSSLQHTLLIVSFLSLAIPNLQASKHKHDHHNFQNQYQQQQASFLLTTENPAKTHSDINALHQAITMFLVSEAIRAQMDRQMAREAREAHAKRLMTNIAVGLARLRLSFKMEYEDARALLSAIKNQGCNVAQLDEGTHNYLMNQFHCYGMDFYQEVLVRIPKFQDHLQKTVKGLENHKFYKFLKKKYGEFIPVVKGDTVRYVKLKDFFEGLNNEIQSSRAAYQAQEQKAPVAPPIVEAKKTIYKAAENGLSTQIVKKYNPALVEEGSLAHKRYLERCLEVAKDIEHQPTDCVLSHEAVALLRQIGSTETLFTEFKGDSAQYRIHKESIGIVNKAAALQNQHGSNQEVKEVAQDVARLSNKIQEHNKEGRVLEAYELADLCWDILDCTEAVFEGVAEGIKNTTNAVVHPITTISNMAQGAFAVVKGVAKAAVKIEEILELRKKDPVLAQQKINEAIDSVSNLLHGIKDKVLDMPVRDIIKEAATFGTECFLFGQAIKCANSVSKLAKSKMVLAGEDAVRLEAAAVGVEQSVVVKAAEAVEEATVSKVAETIEANLECIQEALGIKDFKTASAVQTLKADQLAEEAYNFIRNRTDDIALIAKNTGFSESVIKRIKEHVFYKEHKLRDAVRRFYAEAPMCDAWHRLINGDFKSSDIALLRHEYAELKMMGIFKVEYEAAHRIINNKYPWSP